MKALLMRYKISMLYVVVISLAAGIAGEYFWGNQWIGFFGVCLPLCGIYIYQTYQKEADYRQQHEKKHGKKQNKYR